MVPPSSGQPNVVGPQKLWRISKPVKCRASTNPIFFGPKRNQEVPANVSQAGRMPSITGGICYLIRGSKMCDYSLHAVASRPAKVGETLVSTNFRGAQTLGFAAPEEQDVAVCLIPGTELAFEENVKCSGSWFRSKVIGYRVAKFCKTNMQVISAHHDSLEFPDGSTVLVNSLVKGQRVKVLQMPVSKSDYKSEGHQHEAMPMMLGEVI